MSPCPGGPAVEAVAVGGSDTGSGGSGGDGSSGGDTSGQADGTLEPGDPEAQTDGRRGVPIGTGSGGKESSGTSATTWIIVGVAVGAALLAGGWAGGRRGEGCHCSTWHTLAAGATSCT